MSVFLINSKTSNQPPMTQILNFTKFAASVFMMAVCIVSMKKGWRSLCHVRTGGFQRTIVLFVPPLLTTVTCNEKWTVIIALHRKGFKDEDFGASEIAPQSTNHQIIKNFKAGGSVVVKKASGNPGRSSTSRTSPKGDSAAGSGDHQCRAHSGEYLIVVRRTVWGQQGQQRATPLKEKHQGHANILG